MKKIALFIILGFGIYSCQLLENISPNNFADDFDSMVSLRLSAAVGDSSFCKKGHKKLTTVEISALPAAITDYIKKAYPSATTNLAGKNDAGEYFVSITDGTTKKNLKFDANGVFVKEVVRPSKGERIEVSALPTSITDYITKNYAGASYDHAHKDSSGNFMVGVKLTDGTFKVLIFDSAGAFKEAIDAPNGGRGKGGKGRGKKG